MSQKFLSYDKAKDFYFAYASALGFSIPIVSKESTKVIDGIRMLRRFVCSKERHTRGMKSKNSISSGKLRMNRETHCGFETFIRVNRVPRSEEWIVGLFHEAHNHPLVTLMKKST